MYTQEDGKKRTVTVNYQNVCVRRSASADYKSHVIDNVKPLDLNLQLEIGLAYKSFSGNRDDIPEFIFGTWRRRRAYFFHK
jgi:hypothetical protein